MEFRTPLHITPSPALRIDHQSQILTMGSCFAQVIGHKLQQNKFPACVNPFGVVFNPSSIFKLLTAAAEGKEMFKDTYIQNQGVWYNFDFHSDFSALKKEHLEEKIAHMLHEVRQVLKEAQILTLTFGTSFVYQLHLTGEIVANCHKIPSFNFQRKLLTAHQIVKEFESVYLSLKYLNPDLKFIITVSPVRHLKDGMEENSVSKSILRLACHSITEEFSGVEYFPAYELMMDDLRDYRFYKEDMIHPTEVAENYVWDKFVGRYCTEESQKLIREWSSLMKSITHRPFHPESETHQNFLKETLRKLKEISKVIPVSEEIKIVERQLTGR